MMKLFSFLAMVLVFMFFVAPMPIFANGDEWVEDAGGEMISSEETDISLIHITMACQADADYLFNTTLVKGIPSLDRTDNDVWLAVFWHRSAETI